MMKNKGTNEASYDKAVKSQYDKLKGHAAKKGVLKNTPTSYESQSKAY